MSEASGEEPDCFGEKWALRRIVSASPATDNQSTNRFGVIMFRAHSRAYSSSRTEGLIFKARHITKKVGTDIVLAPLSYFPTC